MKIYTELLLEPLGARGKSGTLDRIRALLQVEAATLGSSAAGGFVAQIGSGSAFVLSGSVLELERRALASRAPMVMADVRAYETLANDQLRFICGKPIRFLAILPMGMGELVNVLILADRAPRSMDMANRLAKIALESLTPPTISTVEVSAALRLQRSIEIMDQATAKASMGVWQCHLAGNALTWSAGVYDIFGLTRGSALSRDRTVEQYADGSRDAMQEARALAIETGTEFQLDAEIFRADGQMRWMRLTASVQSVHGQALRLFGTKQDVTQERRLLDHMRQLAETDAMTGLANRARLQARLDHPEGIGALLLVDLDGFKAVNDTYGHAMGDRCLREVAQRLRTCCADAPLVARLGGDEFAVVLHGDHGRLETERLASNIVECMQAPFEYAGTRVELGASVGLAFRSEGAGDKLFRQADQALYWAKAQGRGTSRTFSEAARLHSLSRLRTQ